MSFRIIVRGPQKRYGPIQAARGVSLPVREGVEVVELRVSRASLEDVFLELTGMPLRAR